MKEISVSTRFPKIPGLIILHNPRRLFPRFQSMHASSNTVSLIRERREGV
jgi:hypothetical protein